MDEANMLGRGRHLDKHGYETVNAIMKRHLERICKIAKKYDYELMVWSDMFFRPWNNGKYVIPKKEIPKEVIDSLPSSVIPVYWDYYQSKISVYDDMLENHKQLSDKTWFAGGAWSWLGFVPFNQFTLKTMIPALHACKEHQIKDIIFTMWGDDGAECSHFSQLPSLFYLAEYARGNTDEASIKAKFKKFCGIDFDEFMQIDCPNNIIEHHGMPANPSKYMLYSDCFNDYLDYTVTEGAGEKYKEYAKALHETARKSLKYRYVFDTAAKLCEVLEIKYELGLRTRKAYEAGDKTELKRLAENEYTEVKKRLSVFIRAFEKQWMRDNKPHGFDVQEMRLGALLYRIDSCRRRILSYANGKIDRIEELDEKLLPYKKKNSIFQFNQAPITATVNTIHHNHNSPTE
jgi:hypothetical protein